MGVGGSRGGGGVVAQPGDLVQRCRVVQKCEDTMVSRN